jgi:integrase
MVSAQDGIKSKCLVRKENDMASFRMRSGSCEVKIQRRGVLNTPVYLTFPDRESAERLAAKVEVLLAQGVVPELLKKDRFLTLGELLREYLDSPTVARSDVITGPLLFAELRSVPLASFNYPWVERWVASLGERGYSPSTVTKRVASLARTVDWGLRVGRLPMETNPVRLLPRGFSRRHIAREKLWAGERDRRLMGDEEERFRAVLRTREERLFFDFALETAMRLSEIHVLTWEQIDLSEQTIYLHRSKNGKRRQIPISSVLHALLEPIEPKSGLVFPELGKKTAARVSHLFRKRRLAAGLSGLHFHDLRHEATSRLYERTDLTDVQIASITGHEDPKMLRRYANLRASKLAPALW